MKSYLKTHLNSIHISSCAKMAPFAGYEMPIQYKTGVITEHNWVRNNAGIFDVSHMGQYILEGENVSSFISYITPTPFNKTEPGKCKYTVLTNNDGGIIDDLIATKLSDNKFYLVLNAACKENDIKWIKQHLPENIKITELDKSLIAIQGPKAESILQKHLSFDLSQMAFMTIQEQQNILITRSGYTGEDGFEISLPHADAKNLWQELLKEEDILPIGLAARDSLRLEAGLPLYGQDLDETTSPIEANLAWVVAKKNDKFIGADRILKERTKGAKRYRVGIELTEKGIARAGAKLFNEDKQQIGILTSGTFSPLLKKSIGMGYVDHNYADIGTEIYVEIRGKYISALTHALSFIKSNTKSVKKRKN